jgi:hypothetical protein
MHCLIGTEPRKVERPQNWKEATDQGYAPPVYDSDEQRRAVQKDFLTKVGNSVLCAHGARSSCTRTRSIGRVHLRVSVCACAHWRACVRACVSGLALSVEL